MPRVDDLIDWLRRTWFFSTLNLTKGYWQVAIAPETKPKTAFSMTFHHWQHQVLPFSFHGALTMFQRLMDTMLQPLHTYAATYLDDVLIHSSTWADH